MKLQKAVKQETVSIAIGTALGCAALIALFAILYLIFPESSVKFDYRVVLGAVCGGAVAVANFFLMAITVQNVVNVTNKDDALRIMRVSYRNRMLMRGIWIVIAIVAPCFQYAAGIIPLFIPSFVIKIRGIQMGLTSKPNAGPAVQSPPDKPDAGLAAESPSDNPDAGPAAESLSDNPDAGPAVQSPPDPGPETASETEGSAEGSSDTPADTDI